jgi:hypothetical protein
MNILIPISKYTKKICKAKMINYKLSLSSKPLTRLIVMFVKTTTP